MDSFVQWELSVLHALQDLSTPFWDKFWTVITLLGESGIFWIVLSLVLMIPKKTRRAGFSMGIALMLGLIFCNLTVKPLVARIRPYDLDPSLTVKLAWVGKPTDFSFPSGHTTAAFEGAFSLFLRHRKWGVAAIVAAVLVGFSRLFLSVHYPSDVLCGAILGTAFAFLAARIVDEIWKRVAARYHAKHPTPES